MKRRRWIWGLAVVMVGAGGIAAADRATSPGEPGPGADRTAPAERAGPMPETGVKMPGTCAKKLVLFCADPSWPDAG